MSLKNDCRSLRSTVISCSSQLTAALITEIIFFQIAPNAPVTTPSIESNQPSMMLLTERCYIRQCTYLGFDCSLDVRRVVFILRYLYGADRTRRRTASHLIRDVP